MGNIGKETSRCRTNRLPVEHDTPRTWSHEGKHQTDEGGLTNACLSYQCRHATGTEHMREAFDNHTLIIGIAIGNLVENELWNSQDTSSIVKDSSSV